LIKAGCFAAFKIKQWKEAQVSPVRQGGHDKKIQLYRNGRQQNDWLEIGIKAGCFAAFKIKQWKEA